MKGGEPMVAEVLVNIIKKAFDMLKEKPAEIMQDNKTLVDLMNAEETTNKKGLALTEKQQSTPVGPSIAVAPENASNQQQTSNKNPSSSGGGGIAK